MNYHDFKKWKKVSESSLWNVKIKTSVFLLSRFVPYMTWEKHLLIFLAKNVFTTFFSCYHSTGQNTILAEWEWDYGLLCRDSQPQISVQHLSENILEI